MKVKIFALVAAFFMLMGGSAWAQSDVKGDVNKDGVVNEQDIAAILAIMAKNNGVAEKTKYYWYVGQSMPDAGDESTWKSSTKDAGFSENGITIYEGENYLVIPDNWNYTAIEPSTNLPFELNGFVKAADKTKIPGYIIRKIVMAASTSVNVTFSK